MSNQQVSILTDAIITFISPWNQKEIKKYIQDGMLPNVMMIAEKFPPTMTSLIKIAYSTNKDKIDLINFDRAINEYRRDLSPLFKTKRGLYWRKMLVSRILSWLKSL